MTEAPGKLKEKVVTILERHIDQSARVFCDVLLPVVADPQMEPRQIDVLIETGTKARPTRTIVEVQDRKSKPQPTEFDGWLKKMEDVGAQHLMCVTKAGYTKTILKKAANRGPTVRLFTLEQLEKSKGNILPPSIMSNDLHLVTYGQLLSIKIIPVHPYQMHPDIDPSKPPDPHYKMFLPHGTDKPQSATEVTDWHLFANPKNVKALPHTGEMVHLKYSYDVDPTKPWKFITKTGWVPLKRFEISIKLSIDSHPIDWEQNYYEQVGEGEVGWILKGTANYGGKDTVVYLPLRKEDDGLYSAGRATAMSENAVTFVGYGDVGHRAEEFSHKPNSRE